MPHVPGNGGLAGLLRPPLLVGGLPEGLEQLLDNVVRRAMKEEMQEVRRQLEGCTAQLSDHERRLRKLEDGPREGPPSFTTASAGRTSSTAWSGGRPSEASSERAEHEPRHLEIKGWCNWDERMTKGVTKDQFLAWYEGMLNHVPSHYQAYLGQPRFFGLRNVKVHLPAKAGQAWETRGILRDAIEMHQEELAGCKPKVVCEDSPANRSRKAAMGRMMDACRRLAATHCMGNGTVVPDWPNSAVCFQRSESAEPILVARVTESGQPVVLPEGVQKAFGCDGPELERAFASARRA